MKAKREVPTWALPLTVVIGSLLLVIVVFKAITGGTEPIGPSKDVKPGTYDFRAMVKQARAEGKMDHGIGTN